MRIAFCGSHGTGKTTLLKLILPILRESPVFTEPGLNWAEKRWEQDHFFYEVFDGIARKLPKFHSLSDKQKQRYFDYWYVWNHYSSKNFIGSRSIFDTWAYGRLLVGSHFHERLFEWATKHINYDFLFYLPVEFPLEADGFRYEDEEFQKAHDRETKLILDYHHVPYHTLTGDVITRLLSVRRILDV